MFSEALADRVLELEARLARASSEITRQRQRAELWKARALNKTTKRTTTARTGEALDASHAGARRRRTV